ncbi:MAG: hypothetical protein LBM93_10245 [Oscillospiraceae bacterium]|jgi:hypothetical protein|nr:hypothetical protein [Oscillospiraceae bacterium]
MKKNITLILLLVMLFTSACSMTGVDTLLTPPRLDEQYAEIEDALKKAVTGSIHLKYPKEGENLSAFTVSDFDNDGEDEALVFYERTDLTAGNTALRMNILDNKEERWVSVYDNATPGLEVERVAVSSIGDSVTKIFIGFTTVSTNEKILEVYDYTNNSLTLTLSENYSYFNLFDTDDDEKNELILISAKNTSSFATLRCLQYREETYYETNIPLSENTNTPAKLLYEITNRRFYIDVNIGNNFIQTEIIELNDNVFRDLLTPEIKQKTVRPVGYLSVDINADGIVEIPVLKENDTVEWHIYKNRFLAPILKGYYSVAGKFAFIYPDNSTFSVTEEKGEFLFKDNNYTAITLAIVTTSQISDKAKAGYKLITTVKNNNYMAKVNTDYFTFEKIRDSFKFV